MDEHKKDMQDLLQAWAEKHHNEYTESNDVRKDWHEAIAEMIRNWSF